MDTPTEGPTTRKVTFGYNDLSQNLTDVTDVNGYSTRFAYQSPDSWSDLTRITGPNQHELVNDYHCVSLCQSGPGRQFRYSYDGNTTTITDPANHTVVVNHLGNQVVSLTRGADTPQPSTWRFGHDPLTMGASWVLDPNGGYSVRAFDPHGSVVADSDGLGRTTTFGYDPRSGHWSDILTITDPLGVPTTFTYDAHDNLATESRPLRGPDGSTIYDRTTSYHHDVAAHPGDVTSVTDPKGKIWSFGYNPTYGTLETATSPHTPEAPAGTGNTTTYGYDNAKGWLTSTTTQLGHVTTYNHDSDGLVTIVKDPTWTASDPDRHRTVRHYDGDRNLDYFIDGNNQRTSYTYNSYDQVTQTHRPDTTVTSTGYDINGNMNSQTDAGSPTGTTSYLYDAQNRLQWMRDPLLNQTTFGYDPAGNLVTKQDPGGACPAWPLPEFPSATSNCTFYRYDTANQVTSVDYSDPTTPDITHVGYDPTGSRINMSEAKPGQSVKTSVWTWGSPYRLTSSTDIANTTVSYGYDRRDLLETITYPGDTPAGGTVTRSYDDAKRPLSVTDWRGNATTFGYDRDSNLTTYAYPSSQGNTMLDTFTPDATASTRLISAAKGATTYANFDYGTRDGANQLTVEDRAGTPGPAHDAYGYNSLEQLTTVTSQGTNRYDGADNLTHLAAGPTMAHDKGHRLCWRAPIDLPGGSCATPPTSLGTITYDFDQRGNRTRGGNATYGYDQANRLTTALNATYAYSGDDLRMSKTVAGVIRDFVWDLADGLPLLLKDGATSYVYGPEGLPLEQIDSNGNVRFFHHDQLGSTRALTDANGTVVWSNAYDPYGNPINPPSDFNPFGFAGEYTDVETGFVYLRARYYDPSTGQFLSIDPAVATTRQVYSYAAGDPLNVTDPSGLHAVAAQLDGTGLAVVVLAASVAAANTWYLGMAAEAMHPHRAPPDAIRVPHPPGRPTGRGTASVGAAEGEDLYGPFHRLESPTQTPEVAELQQQSGEIWGKTPRFGNEPTVQAYEGPLPGGARGVEFKTRVLPNRSAPPGEAWWREGPEVPVEGEFAKLPCIITRNTQTC